MTGRASWLTRRWQDAAQPLRLALLFQAVILVLIVIDVPYAATALVGATSGCVLASLRIQGRPAAGGKARPT